MHCNKTTRTCIYGKQILNTFSSRLNFVAKYVLNLKLNKSRAVDKSMTGQKFSRTYILTLIISIKTFNEVASRGDSCIYYCS